MTPLLSSCLSLSSSLSCPPSFLPPHLDALHFLRTNLSSIWLRSLFQSSLSSALFLCALSSHSFAHFIRSHCTSKLHRSRTPCISLFSFSQPFLFLFSSPVHTEFIFHFQHCGHLSHQLCSRVSQHGKKTFQSSIYSHAADNHKKTEVDENSFMLQYTGLMKEAECTICWQRFLFMNNPAINEDRCFH